MLMHCSIVDWYCHYDKSIVLNIFNLLIQAGKGIAATKYFPQCFYYLVFRIFWLPPRICISMSAFSIVSAFKFYLHRQKIFKFRKSKFISWDLGQWNPWRMSRWKPHSSCAASECPCREIVSIFYVGRNDVPGDPREQLPGCYDHNR